MFEILEKETLAPKINRVRLKAPRIARKRKPGQFIILRVHDEGERIPLTICNSNTDEGWIEIVFYEFGKSTSHFGILKKGDFIPDLVGPLGKPTHIEKYGTCVCVGGGAGIPLVLPIAKALKEKGNNVISIIGARTKDLLILESEVKDASHDVMIATDDGTYGHHGFVTDLLKNVMTDKKVDFCLAVGPVPMMKAVCNITKEKEIRTLVSLNPIMVDGTGMCGCCRVTVSGKIKFACVDGPEFDGHLVDFQELTMRNRAYSREEAKSMKLFEEASHECRLFKAGNSN